MRMGELGLLLNKEFDIGGDVRVVKMKGWKGRMRIEDRGVGLVVGWGNMGTGERILGYWGRGVMEGRKVWEGRGRRKGFEVMGGGYMKRREVEEGVKSVKVGGVRLRGG